MEVSWYFSLHHSFVSSLFFLLLFSACLTPSYQSLFPSFHPLLSFFLSSLLLLTFSTFLSSFLPSLLPSSHSLPSLFSLFIFHSPSILSPISLYFHPSILALPSFLSSLLLFCILCLSYSFLPFLFLSFRSLSSFFPLFITSFSLFPSSVFTSILSFPFLPLSIPPFRPPFHPLIPSLPSYHSISFSTIIPILSYLFPLSFHRPFHLPFLPSNLHSVLPSIF